MAVNDHGETLTSIATRVDVSNPALVALFDELERDGLIERIVDENDRRSKVIVLTPAGEQEVSSLFELLTELRSEFLQGIEQNELLLMLDVITVMKNNLEKMTGQKIY
ncbi:MAG: MarR family transcriptional regulator [Alphaproteobacteria bacterium]